MVYRFGDCEVDTKLLELRRAGTARPIDPLGFDLLQYLIENRDRVVTRHELLDALWPGKVVTDSALSSRLKSVRSNVGDTGSAQRIIKTVHGRGYRFIADLDSNPTTPTTTQSARDMELVIAKTTAVGRDPELGKLRRWLDRLIAGDGTVTFITGDAGVGKTTLIRTFLATARAQSEIFILHGQCVNQRGASEAYLPLLEALGHAGQRDNSIAELIRISAPAWLAQLPSLAIDAEKAAEQVAYSVTTGRMLRELSEVLDRLAEQRNIVMVLEDLHWSDPSTLGWLEYHARRNDKARMLLIVSGRPEGEFYGTSRELAVRGHGHHLPLESIDEADISSYLGQRLDHPPAPALAALTYQRTQGFPLFIDTLVDHWFENGLIQKSDGHWVAAKDDRALFAGVPENLAQLIDQQLSNQDKKELCLLETAALAGSPFTAAAVAYALEDSEENIEAHFSHLARQHRIVRHAGDLRWPDGTVTAAFEFRHELFREALYERVATSRRVRLHAAFGERLEQAYGDSPGPVAGQIADHFARAQEGARALKYFYPAASLAFNRSAYRETVAMVNRALEMIGAMPESTDTQRKERELLLLRGSALISLEGWSSQKVEDSYVRARQISDKLKLADNTPEIYGIAALHENRGRYAQSQAVLESLLERGSELKLEAHELLACSLFHQGQFDQSKANADRALEDFDPREVSEILARYGENPGVSCHSWAALDLWFMGFPDSALQRSDMALELANGHFYSGCSALTLRTFLHQFRNEPEETLAWAKKSRGLAEERGFAYRVAQILILEGWARGRLGTDEASRQDALASIEKGIRRHHDMGSEMDLPYQLTLKAEVLAAMGRIDDALEVQQLAIDTNPQNRDFFYEAEMQRQLATLLLAKDSTCADRASDLLQQSLDLARRQGARMLELRTCLTRCEITNGADQRNREELQAVLHNLEEGHDTPDWAAAHACA